MLVWKNFMTIKYLPVLLAAAVLSTSCPADARQLGGPPARLATPYQTEQAWAAGEIASDIAEMAALALRQTRPTLVAPPAMAARWIPEEWAAFAAEQLGPSSRASNDARAPLQYALLTDLTVPALVRASAAVSASLKQNMRDAGAHESAALVIGAFGLRESAGGLSDVRWPLNRMTAHLAMASALRRDGSAMTMDGHLAQATLLALSDRDASTLAAVAMLPETSADAALGAWARALRLRVAEDWRIVAQPAKALRIEKLAYFRARREAMNGTHAGQELALMGESVSADFARLVLSFTWGVEDGNIFVRPAQALELMEIADAHRLVQGRPLPSDLPAAVLNVRAGRLVTSEGPQVLPWGAWAEFFQRHIGNYIGQVDRLHRQSLASPGEADAIKRRVDAQFGHLALFPVATAQRTKGRGTEADLTYIRQAIALAVRAPELVTYDFWAFLDLGARYEMVTNIMPERRLWFAMPTATMPYEAGIRTGGTVIAIPLPELEALINEASSDLWLLNSALRPRPNNQALVALVLKLLQARNGYDLSAIDYAVAYTRDAKERVAWRRRGCELSVNQCVRLASLLAVIGDEAAAAAEYERAFKDPSLDQVSMSNSSQWLVGYYERNRQLDRALELAERSAAVGSARGMTTLARLYERRNRSDEARFLYERMASRYQRSGDELAGFLYRQVVVGGRQSLQADWNRVVQELFPGGLKPMPTATPAEPTKGVFVYKDSYESRRLRLQAGDIIIGLDGWLVENKEQYDAVMAFTDDGVKHKITAWRGVLFTIEADEDIGMELQTFPLRGWIQ